MENKFMSEALILAKEAAARGEVPVGAVLVKDGAVVAAARNTREEENDVTGHAECNCLRLAAKKLGSWRLADCDLYVTLEPCPLCAAALAEARVRAVYFGAYDKRLGALESMTRLYDLPLASRPAFYGGIMETETSSLLTAFFEEKRKERKEKR